MGDSPESIPTRLARGETADVVILDGAAADELARRGLVRADTKIEFARSLVGVVLHAGAAKPDIGSVEAFRATLLAPGADVSFRVPFEIQPSQRNQHMLAATCHCGAVRVEVPRKPRRLTDCNCSICRRYGTLWAYYKASEVRITGAPRATSEYSWGDKSLRFVRCSTCGCVTHWEPIHPKEDSRMGVNARNFEPGSVESVRIRVLDGASTWKFLD